MRTTIVLTLSGKDRIGIVEEVTRILLQLGGNIEASHMARLGGEFAILVLVSLPSERLDQLDRDLQLLKSRGYQYTRSQTEMTGQEAHPGWLPYRIKVDGADHEGIIHEISHLLSQRGISIETIETSTHPAPHSGVPIFTMTTLVVVPPALTGTGWENSLISSADRLNVEVIVQVASSR